MWILQAVPLNDPWQAIFKLKPAGPTGKMPVQPIRFHSCMRFQRLITVPAMVCFVRQSVAAASLCILLFSTSCEKHPIGQLPDVQREQPDPAKKWSEASKNSDESSSKPQPADSPEEAR